jgi:Mrp family chromosome partitioning ATPase
MVKGVSVISGKGGTGKTLIAVNIALEAVRRGVKTGLLDGDISNPNTATLLSLDVRNVYAQFTQDADHRVIPFSFESLPGFQYFTVEVVAKDIGIGKSGSEYGKIIAELIRNAVWDVDWLVVDSPAGYYDIHKSIVASFDTDYVGSVVIANPAHPRDLYRVLDLHRINDIPVVGVIENMSSFTCDACNTTHYIFGQSETTKICDDFGVEFFGSVPLSNNIRKGISQGNPILPDGEGREIIKNIVDKINQLKPRRPGFITEMIQKIDSTVESSLMKLISSILVVVADHIDIRGLQLQYGFPGNRLIRLNLLDKTMTNTITSFHFIIRDGKLKLVENLTSDPKVQIDMYYKAFAWALLKEKDGKPYDFWRALWNDELRVYGEKGVEQMTAWYFLQDVFNKVMEVGGQRLIPLVKVIA